MTLSHYAWMANPLDSVGFLPTVRCSTCGAAVEIMAMGDHACGKHSSTPSQSLPQDSPPPPPSPTTKPQSSRARKSKPLPPIDSSTANRPFLRQNRSTGSASGSNPRNAFPSSAPLATQPPYHASQSSCLSYLPSQTALFNGLDNSSHYGDQVPGNIQNSVGPPPKAQPPLELKSQPASDPTLSETFHRRNFSIDSKSSYRTSCSSKLSSASLSRRPSMASLFRAIRDSEDVPPMPRPPAEGFSVFHGRDMSSCRDIDSRASSNAPVHTYKTSGHSAVSATPQSDYENIHDQFLNADADEEENFSLSKFAQSLGLEFDSSTESSPSESSQSEARSGSSMSSAPSEGSWARAKQSQVDRLDAVTEEPPSSKGNNFLEETARAESPITLEPPPPIPADLAGLDSPTDPAIVQGTVSLIPENKDVITESKSPVPPLPTPRYKTVPSTPRVRAKGRCKGCGELIIGKSVSSADGRLTGRYHRECFMCYHCQAPFKTADFYVLDDRPYCKQHYHKLNGSLCSACNWGIEGHYLESIERLGRGAADRQKFHPECLRCCLCRTSLKGDYFEWNGNVYCERDARKATAMMPQRNYRRPAMMPSPLPTHLEFPDRQEPFVWDYGHYHTSASISRRYPERRTTRLMMI